MGGVRTNLWNERSSMGSSLPSASVVVPAYGNVRRLEAVLEALARQDFEGEWEVIVVDDGSDPPLDPRSPDPERTRVLRQERRGFGLSRARHLGAMRSEGDVICFIDSDMLPSEGWLTAHVRAHVGGWVLGSGFRRHVETTHVDPVSVREAPSIASLFDGQAFDEPKWIEQWWRRTHEGTTSSDVLWRVTSGGNQSVSRALYYASGGYEPYAFTKWGGEDNDFGYRAYQAGGFVVPVREALAWHLGPGTSGSEEAEDRLRIVRYQLGGRIPDDVLPWLKDVPPTTPRAVLELDLEGRDDEEVLTLVSGILSALPARVASLRLVDQLPRDWALLNDVFTATGRVAVTGPEPAGWRWAPVRVAASSSGLSEAEIAELVSDVGEGRAAVSRLVDHMGRCVAQAVYVRAQRQVREGLLPESALAEFTKVRVRH